MGRKGNNCSGHSDPEGFVGGFATEESLAVEDCFAASPKPTGRPGAKSDIANQRTQRLLSASLADALTPEVSMHNRVEIDRSAE